MLSQEIKSVVQVDKNKQYEYFIKKIVDYEEVWSLRDNDGWATLGENEKMYFPLWPKKEFADICISDEWINYYSESIDLEEFLDDWIEGLKKDGVQITIMWNDGKGIEVEFEQLKRDIERELEKY